MVLQDDSHPAPKADQSLQSIINTAINAVDIETRAHLLTNVVVTGGSSLLYGFTERLHNELLFAYPGPRVRIQATGSVPDRKFAGWIGGSILASLGTFHQMWVSRQEYQEFGAGIVEKRCK